MINFMRISSELVNDPVNEIILFMINNCLV